MKRPSRRPSEEKQYQDAYEYLAECQKPHSETAIFERCVRRVS